MVLSRSMRLVAPLAAVLAATACGPPAAQGPPPPPEEVTISLDRNPVRITVSPDTVRATRGQQIRWQSDVSFAVVVPDQATVFPASLPPQAMHGAPGQPLQAQVRGNAPDGEYHYLVVVWDSVDATIRILDPEIVVGPAGPPMDTVN